MAFEPIRISTQGPSIEDKREPVFYIDDIEYTAPVQLSGGTLLEAVFIAVNAGRAAGATFLAQRALGSDAINALFACKYVTPAQARSLITQLGEQYMAEAMTIVDDEETEGKGEG